LKLIRESSQAAGARAEISELHAAQLLYPNTTHVIDPNSRDATFVEKHNVFEIEVDEREGGLFKECGPDVIPRLYDVDRFATEHLLPAFRRAVPEGVHLDSRHAIKVQVNTGDRGCFPVHVDSDLQYSGRVLSSIVYLNPNWKSANGGELVLYPFPFDRVVIPPTMGRLVVFSSSSMLHRVMPSKAAERVCLTVWYSKHPNTPPVQPHKDVPAMPQVPTEKTDPAVFRDQVLAYLLHPRHRLPVAKLFYASEWRTSIFESHHESPERDRLLQAHAKDTERLRKYFSGYTEFIENEFPIKDPEERKRVIEKHGHLLQWF
jgi:Rps23 Pro-64 3,4-dihydroxylase Tpa1-like proline 4-hydroxylase